MVEINAEHAFTLLYCLVSLFSATAFGYLAELCDVLDICPSRVRTIIAFSVFVFLLSALMFIAQVLRLAIVDSLHLAIAPLLFALNTVSAAIAISPRTSRTFLFSQELVWWAEVACVLLVFLAFADRDAPVKEKEGLEVPAPVSVQPSQPASVPVEPLATSPAPDV